MKNLKAMRRVLTALNIEVDPNASMARYAGALAAAGFVQAFDRPKRDVADHWKGHHEFAEGFTEALSGYGDRATVWSSVLFQLALAVPVPEEHEEPLPVASGPYEALHLAASCLVLLSIDLDSTDPDEKTSQAQAVETITSAARHLSALTDADHVVRTAGDRGQ